MASKMYLLYLCKKKERKKEKKREIPDTFGLTTSTMDTGFTRLPGALGTYSRMQAK